MLLRRAFIVSLLLVIVSAPGVARAAREGLTTESSTGAGGVVAVRSVTWSDGAAPDPDPFPSTTPTVFPDPARGVNSYLWIDRNHLDALAERVAITGDGAHVIAGWWLNNMRVSTYDTAVDATPEWAHPLNVQFVVDVDADGTGDKITATGRGDSLYVFDAASAVATHSHWYEPSQVGYRCAVSGSGNTYMAGSGNPDGTSGEIYVRDGDGTIRFKAPLTAPPEGVDVSADGLVVAANVRAYVKVWDALTGALRDSVAIPGETQNPAVLSGDGTYLVTGGFSHMVRVYQWNGSDYAPLWSYNMPGTTWTTAIAISDDGSTVAAGGWNSSGSFAGRVVLLDIGSPAPVWTDTNYGDWVSSLSLTPDGRLLAAGSWGRYAGTFGNLVSVYNRTSSNPVHYIRDDGVNGVGSCLSVEISNDGRYVVAGGKAVHAREMGSGGWVMAIELADPAAVEADGSLAPAPALRVTPNPSRTPMQLAWNGPAGRPGEALRIFTAEGRLVRVLDGPAGALAGGPAGGSGWTWDGADALGRIVPAGNYLVRGDGVAVRVVRLP